LLRLFLAKLALVSACSGCHVTLIVIHYM
jgi:hypothetical protein